MPNDLDALAERLYALAPQEFTAARDAAVKAADRALAKQVAALRKPTTSAWLVNALVRNEPDLLDELLDLGPSLAQAQQSGDGAAVRALGEQRRALVTAVAKRAADLSPVPVTAGVRAEVVTTLEAGMADPASAQAVRSGRLVRALCFAGFGGVDLAGAVAVSGRPAANAQAGSTRDAAALAGAEAAALDAAGALDDAVRSCQRSADVAEQAAAREREAHQVVARVTVELEQAEQVREEASALAAAAMAASRAEQERLAEAQATAEAARAALDALRRHGS